MLNNRQEAAQAMLNERQEAVQAMFNRQPAAQTEGSTSSEQQLRARLKWGKTVEDLTLAIYNYFELKDDFNEGPYSLTDWEERDLINFEDSLGQAQVCLNNALAAKLRFEKSLEEQHVTEEAAQEDGPQATEEQLQDRIEWGKKVENLIVALAEYNEAEAKLFGEGPHAFTRKEKAILEEFNEPMCAADCHLGEMMAFKLRFEGEHNL